MVVFFNRVLERVSEKKSERKKYKVKKLKPILGNLHAVLVDINDEKSEILVALSVLEDKNEFKVL
jgi:hypothetical protein